MEPGSGQRSRRGIGTAIAVIAVVLAVLIAWQGRQLLLMVVAGVLFAIFLDALARWTAGWARLSRGWSLAVVLVTLAGLALVLAVGAYPGLASQAADLAEGLPQAVRKIRSALENSPLSKVLPSGSGDAQRVGASVMSRVFPLAAAAADGVVAAVVILFVGVYLAADPDLYRRGLIRLLPRAARERARQVLSELGRTLRRWVLVRLVLMVINGGLTALGLWIIGIPLAPILGLIAGLLNFVPNIGPFIAAVPAILIAFAQSLNHAVYAAVLHLVLQMLDGYVFTPLAQKRAVALAPALVISFQVLMGLLAGALGLLLATPIVAALAILVRMLYVDRPGEESP